MSRLNLFSTYCELHCTSTLFRKLHLLVQAAEVPGSNRGYNVSMTFEFCKFSTKLQGAVAHSWVYCQRSYSWIGRISRLITVTYLHAETGELLTKLLQYVVAKHSHLDFSDDVKTIYVTYVCRTSSSRYTTMFDFPLYISLPPFDVFPICRSIN